MTTLGADTGSAALFEGKTNYLLIVEVVYIALYLFLRHSTLEEFSCYYPRQISICRECLKLFFGFPKYRSVSIGSASTNWFA